MPIVWSYGHGGNELGMKRILAFHLIEYSLGLEHKTRGNVVEAFLCDVTPLAEQVELSRAASKIFSLLAEGAKDKKIRMHLIYISSWKTGTSKNCLSSQISSIKR